MSSAKIFRVFNAIALAYLNMLWYEKVKQYATFYWVDSLFSIFLEVVDLKCLYFYNLKTCNCLKLLAYLLARLLTLS